MDQNFNPSHTHALPLKSPTAVSPTHLHSRLCEISSSASLGGRWEMTLRQLREALRLERDRQSARPSSRSKPLPDMSRRSRLLRVGVWVGWMNYKDGEGEKGGESGGEIR